MSFAEIEKEVRTLPRSKRRQLIALLTTLEHENGAVWKTEIERRKQEMKRGNKISREDAMKLLGISENDLATTR